MFALYDLPRDAASMLAEQIFCAFSWISIRHFSDGLHSSLIGHPMRLGITIAGVCSLFVLVGCASYATQQDTAASTTRPKHGWISGFYTEATPRSELPKCVAELPPEQLSSRRFVKIDYRHSRRMLIEVAELPEIVGEEPVRIGDRVELIPQDCPEGLLSHITRMMPRQPK
jgi:hypothetical protein